MYLVSAVFCFICAPVRVPHCHHKIQLFTDSAVRSLKASHIHGDPDFRLVVAAGFQVLESWSDPKQYLRLGEFQVDSMSIDREGIQRLSVHKLNRIRVFEFWNSQYLLHGPYAELDVNDERTRHGRRDSVRRLFRRFRFFL